MTLWVKDGAELEDWNRLTYRTYTHNVNGNKYVEKGDNQLVFIKLKKENKTKNKMRRKKPREEETIAVAVGHRDERAIKW